MEKIRTIIVDDEKLSAEGIKTMLQLTGVKTEILGVFYSSSKALEFLKNNEVDLVITDINMPQISGLELIAEMKEVNDRASVIIVTGFGSLKYAQEAMRYGVRYFLQKPCSIEELQEAVESCLKDIDYQKKDHLLHNKELIEQAIFGKDDISKKMEFSLLMYQDIFFEIIDPIIKEIFEDKNVEYISGGIRDVVGYYIFSEISDEDLLEISGLPVPAVIHFQKDVTLQSILKEFEDGKEILGYSFYFEESVIITRDKIVKADIYGVLQNAIRHFVKEIKKNELTAARETLREIFSMCKVSWLPPKELKNDMNSLIKEIIDNFRLDDFDEDWEELVANAEYANSLLKIFMEVIDQVEIKSEKELAGNKISTNLNLMIEKYYSNSELSLRWISKNMLYLNPEYMGKMYLKETGERFSVKLQEVRLKKAADFLEEGYKIYEVAKMTGYENNPNYFGRLFRQHFGITPREFRKATNK